MLKKLKKNCGFFDIGDVLQKWKPSATNMVNILLGSAAWIENCPHVSPFIWDMIFDFSTDITVHISFFCSPTSS